MTDTLEQRLADALSGARDDERWAVAPRPDALAAVRRGARRRRQRSAALTVAASALVVVGVVGLAGSTLPGSRDVVGQVATPRDEAGPVPGVVPEWRPASGREWLLTSAQWEAFTATHTVPDQDGGQSRVPSPAPLGPASAALATEAAAGLPEGTSIRREDAVGGDPDTSAVLAGLPDGTQVTVERRQLTAPLAWDRMGGDIPHDAWRVEDVPGTSSALLLQPDAPYGFGDDRRANGVVVVSRSGLMTSWVVAEPVTVEQLRDWAVAAAQSAS